MVLQKLTEILSDAISEHLFFKILLGEYAPRPPSKSMLCMLYIVLHTLKLIFWLTFTDHLL